MKLKLLHSIGHGRTTVKAKVGNSEQQAECMMMKKGGIHRLYKFNVHLI